MQDTLECTEMSALYDDVRCQSEQSRDVSPHSKGDGSQTPMLTMISNSLELSGMTDRRDWRTSGIFFNEGSLLISCSDTGRFNARIGVRSTVLQSSFPAVGS